MKNVKQLFNYKLVLLCILLQGLTACDQHIPRDDTAYIARFNKDYAPEYQIIDRVLYVDWKGNETREIKPLKLKIPLVYLEEGINKWGEIGYLHSSLKPMAPYENDPGGKKVIYEIRLDLLRNGQPVDQKLFSEIKDKANKENIEKIKTTLKNQILGIEQSVDHEKSESSKISQAEKKLVDYMDNMYWVAIYSGGGANYKMNDPQDYYRSGTMLNAVSENGLDKHISYFCHNINELKQNLKNKSPGYVTAQSILNDLKNKPPSDLSPENCLSDDRYQFWVSPENTKPEDAVGIRCWQAGGCSIKLLYKTHYVEIFTKLSSTETVAQWQDYRKKVTDILNQFENS